MEFSWPVCHRICSYSVMHVMWVYGHMHKTLLAVHVVSAFRLSAGRVPPLVLVDYC